MNPYRLKDVFNYPVRISRYIGGRENENKDAFEQFLINHQWTTFDMN